MNQERNYKFILIAFYVLALGLLISKSASIRYVNLHRPTQDEVIEHNCDQPEDFAKEKWLSRGQRKYYEELFKKTK
jgi:hypothetical protein